MHISKIVDTDETINWLDQQSFLGLEEWNSARTELSICDPKSRIGKRTAIADIVQLVKIMILDTVYVIDPAHLQKIPGLD